MGSILTLLRQYPRLNLMLRAPVEIENLLPYDLKFRIHDKNTGLSSSNFLVKGGSSPVHTVELGTCFSSAWRPRIRVSPFCVAAPAC